jgi:hypothetical protein
MTKLFLLTPFLLFSNFCANSVEKQVKTNAPLTPSPITKEASPSVQQEFDTIGNTIGLIVLNEQNYGKEDFVHFYNEDGSLWYKFTFYYDDSDGKFEYANGDFRPFAFHKDYFVLALKCVGKENGRYEVIVNETTGLRKYVKADDPVLRLETWEEHILNVFAVTFNQVDNPLLDAPSGQVKKVVLSNAEPFFHPIEIKGKWLKVKWKTSEETKRKEPNHDSGWIRWKEGESLLVELFYFA